jgi:hypothetical protein
METPEEMLEAYKKKQKNKIAEEDQQIMKTIKAVDNTANDLQKIAKELHGINQKLDLLNKTLRRK